MSRSLLLLVCLASLASTSALVCLKASAASGTATTAWNGAGVSNETCSGNPATAKCMATYLTGYSMGCWQGSIATALAAITNTGVPGCKMPPTIIAITAPTSPEAWSTFAGAKAAIDAAASTTCSVSATPAAAPTPVNTPIQQTVTITSVELAAYTGDLKAVYEAAYAITLGIWDSVTKAIKAGNTLSSTATANTRRAGIKINYSASVKPTLAVAAKAASVTLKTNTAALVTGMATANTNLGKSITVPAGAAVTASTPTNTAPPSTAHTTASVSLILAGAMALAALRQ